MKKMLLSLVALLCTMGAWAVEIGTDVNVNQIENGVVYTIQGYRGQWRYMFFDGTNYDTRTTTTAYAEDLENATNYQWTFYKSANNVWYLFNIGTNRFIGTTSGATTIPLVENGPVSTAYILKDSEITSATAIMMSSDNGTNAMHCANSGNGYKIMNWSGAFSNTISNECAFKVTKLGALDESTLAAIETAVSAYEEPIIIPSRLENLNTIVTKLEEVEPYIGTGYGKYTSANANYATLIDEYRAFHTAQTAEATATVAQIDEKIAEATNLRAQITINTPTNGSFIRVKHSTVENSYLVSGTTGRTQFSKAEDIANNANSIFYYTDGKLLGYTTGTYLIDSQNMLAYIGQPNLSCTISFTESNLVSYYNLGFRGDRFLYSDGEGDTNGASSPGDEANYCFSLDDVTTLPVAIGATGYATFYSPVAVTLPEGLEAYYVSAKTEISATLTQIENVIPAETGVILKGTAEQTYNLTIGGTAESVDNLLSGTIADTYKTEDAYVLACVDEVTGFYKAEKNQSSNTAFLNNGFKAYLPVDVAGARFLSFDFGTETAIESVESVEGNAVVYDLAGRRVQSAQKGIYVVNGKVVVR